MRIPGRPLLFHLAWHVLAILLFLFLPVLKWKAPWWDLPRKELLAVAVLIAGYATAALAVMVFARPGTPRAFSRALALALGSFGLFLLFLLLTRLNVPRNVLLPVFLGVAALAPLVVAPRVAQILGIGVLAIALLGIAVAGGRVAFAPPKKAAKVVASDVKTAFYVLRVRSHEGLVGVPATRGGGLDQLGDRILLGTGDGSLYTLRVAGDDVQAHRLSLRVPANREEFAAAFKGSANAPRLASAYSEDAPEV